MTLRPTIRLCVLLWLAVLSASSTGFAQARPTVRSLETTFLLDRLDRRDMRTSRLRYAGPNIGARLGYVGRGPRQVTEFGIELGNADLKAASGAGLQEIVLGGFNVAMLRAAAPNTMVGLMLDASAINIRHRYHQQLDPEQFGTAAVTLAPQVEWRPDRWDGRVHARASFAAISYVLHPYSRIKAVDDVQWTLLGPARWREGSVELVHTSNDRKRIAMRTSYRLELSGYRDAQGAASVQNGLRFAALVRLGKVDP